MGVWGVTPWLPPPPPRCLYHMAQSTAYLLRAMPPWAQAFMSAPWYMGPPCGCCCIMGFCGPRRPDIMALGGLLPGGPNEGSPCWPIPAREEVTGVTRGSVGCDPVTPGHDVTFTNTVQPRYSRSTPP